jgi:geranyl-CoA carboxylase alpha subunit
LALIPFLTEMSNSLRLQLCKDELKTITECASNLLFNGKKIASMYSPFVRNMRLRHRGEVHSLLIKESREALKESPHHRTHAVQLNTTRWHVQVGAVDVWLDDASFEPASQGGAAAAGAELRAPFNGKVIRLAATVGQTVQRGDALVTLESMKLEHALCAARDGVVKAINVEVGQQVSTGQVLVVLG